jgi:hypothetical protein
MKPYIFFCLSIAFFNLQASSTEDKTLSALYATYEDTTLQLKGEVKVEHGLGLLQAEKAFLHRHEGNKNLPFSRVYLEDKVDILCKDTASLKCDLAELDFLSLKGKLHSTSANPVLYVDKGIQGSHSAPLELQSKEIDLIFEKQENEDGTMEYLCKEIVATKDVQIRYANEFAIHTNQVLYHKSSSTVNQINGIFTTSPDTPSTLFYKDETIETSFIEGNLDKQTLHLKNPKGSLPSSLFSPKQQGQLFFSCHHLIWDYSKSHLILQKEVQIQESHFGCLIAEDLVTIKQNNSKDSAIIESILVQGKSTLSRADALLTCYGSLFVDGVKGQIIATSPSSSNPISFQNPDLSLFGDRAVLEYTEPLHELSSLTFQGNIKIHAPSSLKTARYALADRLVYAPDTKTVILSAHSGKKVLFWDEESGTTLSAKEVHITQNMETHKPDIKGVGNVKLSLSQEEQTEMKRHFPSIPLSGGIHEQ